MLKRIATGIVLAPLFLWAMFALPAAGIQVLLGIIVAVAVYESSLMIGFKNKSSCWLFTVVMVVAGYVCLLIVTGIANTDWIFFLTGIAALWWIYHIFELRRFSISRPGLYSNVIGRMTNVSIVLMVAWIAINALYLEDPRAPVLLVYMLVTIWIADSGAYFSGKYFGTHKLAPNVSPGKTIEGVVGGVVTVAVFAAIFGLMILNMSGMKLVGWVVFTGLVASISVVGDLNESALKRISGRKDSGTLLPGHGGIFDRIDAITAAAPVFYFGWQLFGWGLYG